MFWDSRVSPRTPVPGEPGTYQGEPPFVPSPASRARTIALESAAGWVRAVPHRKLRTVRLAAPSRAVITSKEAAAANIIRRSSSLRTPISAYESVSVVWAGLRPR